MNHCSLQQNAFLSREESRGFVPIYSHPVDSVVCPKPRRANNVIRPFRLHFSLSGADDVCDSKAGEDLLDIFRRKVCLFFSLCFKNVALKQFLLHFTCLPLFEHIR
jgi:hypothetical protein